MEREAVMAEQERQAGQPLDITHPSRVKRNFNGWSHSLDLPPWIKIKTQTTTSAITTMDSGPILCTSSITAMSKKGT